LFESLCLLDLRLLYSKNIPLSGGKGDLIDLYLLPDYLVKLHYRLTCNELHYYKLTLFLNLQELAQVIILVNSVSCVLTGGVPH